MSYLQSKILLYMHTYVYIYTHIHVCIRYVYICIYTRMHTHVSTCAHVTVYVCIHACVHVYTCMYVYKTPHLMINEYRENTVDNYILKVERQRDLTVKGSRPLPQQRW